MAFDHRKPYKGRIQAVIFDWAGTTVDFGCMAPATVFIEVFKRHGVDITMAEARGPMGMYKRDHIAEIGKMDNVARQWKEVHGKPFSDQDVDALYKEFVPLQVETIAQYADLVPGVLDVMERLRSQDIKIGATTGYTREMMEVLEPEAAAKGYTPDCSICVSDVAAGRPAPWMALHAAEKLGVYPIEAIVKVGDTRPDIAEGLNAGMWSVGVTQSGNEVGLSLEDFQALDSAERNARTDRAAERLSEAGAHCIVDTVADLSAVVEVIETELAHGALPHNTELVVRQ